MSDKGTNAGKDVLYIDVDDEITAIIDKVNESNQKIVALVLPKRATALQSIVNMRLLQRSSDAAKKKIVLITSELSLLPLAGTVGLHVAKTLQSKPEIPPAPARSNDITDTVEEVGDGEEAVSSARPLDKTRTVGELAGAAAVESELDDTIELDNEPSDGTVAPGIPTATKTSKDKKKFNIPNFNKFRLWLVLGALGLIVLIVGAVAALKVMPKATVSIKTNSTAISSTVPLTFKTATDTEINIKDGVIPATVQQIQKTQEQQVPASGQQNNGQKATGAVTVKNCSDDPLTIPAGTGVVASGLTFITQKALVLDSGNFSSGSICKATGDHIGSVDVAAQSPGAKYNVDTQPYTIAGQNNSSVTATGSAMTGGTDDIVKIVTQADVDSAKQKIGGQDTEQLHNDLKNGLITKGLYAVDQTFKSGEVATKLSANPGDKADAVTVTQTVTYTMMGVKRDDLEKVIANAASEKIDTKKQSILDYGIEDAQVEVQSQDANGAAVNVTTTVVAGPELDVATIKKQVAGKKAGDASRVLKATPGVTDVKVEYSPFWVSSIPGDTSKVTVTIEKPTVKANDDTEP